MNLDQINALPAHLQKRLIQALKSGLLGLDAPVNMIRSHVGVGDGAEAVAAAMQDMASLGFTSATAAVCIAAVHTASQDHRRPDLVWSGPEISGLHARDTRQVYEEVIKSAWDSIWVSTYAFFDGPKAFEVLARHMDETPGLKARLLLNIQRAKGDTSSADAVVRRFTDQFWEEDWPGEARPSVYYDPRSVDTDGTKGVLHAKAVVADDEAVFITSANLTEAALDRNLELGILERDRVLALSVAGYLQGLIDQGVLSPLPME
jgi:phosphatidylserine/phosphatidylglycerophosphate/cardiolipin synthase-like enzyme